MIELSEHSLFAGETLAAGGRQPGISENFDGNQVAEVFSLGEIDHAHAAFAQHLFNGVGTESFEFN